MPVSIPITFPAGVTSVTTTIPVLANPNDSVNESVNLVLTSPSGMPIFGGGANQANATLTIINTDPLLTGPTVTDVRLYGPVNSITGVEVGHDGQTQPRHRDPGEQL